MAAGARRRADRAARGQIFAGGCVPAADGKGHAGVSVRATTAGAGEVAAPRSGAAPLATCVMAQTRAELNMTLRQGERVLITVILPAFFLVFFAGTNIVPAGMGKPVDFLLPGML